MSFADAIAFCALVIGIISVAGIMLDAYKLRLTNREKELELRTRLADADGARGAGQVAEMEDRLRVLERIATDRRHMLADEIDQLREKEIAR